MKVTSERILRKSHIKDLVFKENPKDSRVKAGEGIHFRSCILGRLVMISAIVEVFGLESIVPKPDYNGQRGRLKIDFLAF